MKRIEVAAGIICCEDEVLLALRADDQHQGGLWEFPGGKIETDETAEQALVRELKEELGVDADDISLFQQLDYDYPDKHVSLLFYWVRQFGFAGKTNLDAKQALGTLGAEGQRLQWVRVTQLNQYQFPAANQPVVDALLSTKLYYKTMREP